ncbi:MAG: hypothetical protein EAZ08_01585 [Cytophagales bacterium]|nr:MAG: hypothetical protein EAZ08_01585 [Cytophagales bacterium]
MKRGLFIILVVILASNFQLLKGQSARLADLQDALLFSNKRSFDAVLMQMQPLIDSLDFLTAQEELKKTIETCTKLAHRRFALPQVYDMLARQCQQHNRPDLALEYYLNSIETYEKEQFAQALAHTYYRIGFMHFAAKHYARADSYLHKALKTAQDSLEGRQVINAYNAIALCYKDAKNYTLANKYFDKALKIAQSKQDSIWIGMVYNSLGNTYAEEKSYSEALPYFEKGLKINIAYGGETENIVNMQNAIAECYLRLNEPNKAEKYYLIAQKTAEKAQIHFGLSQAYHGLAQINANKGDFRRAYYFQNLHKKITDAISLASKNTAILEMQHKFDAEKKEIEIQLLNISVERYHAQQIALIFSLVLLGIVGCLLFLSYRKTQKIKQLLQLQEIELQQQQELISQLQ